MGQRVKPEDAGSAASCQGGLRGAKELGKKTAWLLSQHHGGNTALQSVSIVMNWHFLMGGKKQSAGTGSSFIASPDSSQLSEGGFEKPLAFSGVQNYTSESSLRLPLSHPSWLLFSFPSAGSAANLCGPHATICCIRVAPCQASSACYFSGFARLGGPTPVSLSSPCLFCYSCPRKISLFPIPTLASWEHSQPAASEGTFEKQKLATSP